MTTVRSLIKMVSTRRTAHVEPAGDPPALGQSNTLSKKPVRKATAKTTQPAATAKPTRGKKATAAPMEPSQQDAELLQQAPEAAPVKTTRRGAGRSTRQHVETVAEAQPLAASRATKPTRSTAAKAKRTAVLVEEEAGSSQPNERPATRRTRAAAQPLSPKKVTQVTRPTTRNKNAKNTAAPRKSTTAPRPASRTTGRGRKRAVSDENAEVEVEVAPTEIEEDEISLAPHNKQPSPVRSPVKSSKKQSVPSEASMSSRATTPSASPIPDFSRMQDENEYRRNAEDDNVADSDSDDVPANGDGSDDELCGPKTPMRRASRTTEARFMNSMQKSMSRSVQGMQVSTSQDRRRRHEIGTTPQTQEPYNPPKMQMPPEGPMTVNRATRTALVLRGLAPIDNLREASVEAVKDSGPEVPIEIDSDSESASEDEVEVEETPLPVPNYGANVAEAELPSLSRYSAEDAASDDPDATVIIHEEMDESEDEDDAGTADTEEIVIMDASADAEDSFVESELDDELLLQTPPNTTETIVWENIRQDVTIPFNFDAHITREQIDGPQLLGTLEDLMVAPALCDDAADSESMAEDLVSLPADGTVNFNDFVDLAALAEPTRRLSIPQTASDANEPETLPEAQDAASGHPNDFSVHHADAEGAANGETAMDIASEQDDGTVDNSADRWAETTEMDPAQDQSSCAVDDDVIAAAAETIPHYALPTISFDARRKSLPAFSMQTPVKTGTRPTTSDGASAPRVRSSFFSSRFSFAPSTPQPQVMKTRRSSQTPAATRLSSTNTPVATPGDRHPRMAPRRTYEEHANTVAMPPRFRTPLRPSTTKPATARKPAKDTVTPRASSLRKRPVRPATPEALEEEAASLLPTDAQTSPIRTPSERFPKLASRANYTEHAQTVAAPRRFQTPVKVPLNQPSTAQKRGSLRQVALTNTAPMPTRTPVKTPLKPPSMTPGQAPMTPHPSAPLRGVVAMVEVYTLEGASASAPFIALLHRLGAKTTKAWSDRVTHVVFKDGSPTTLQRVRLHNKGVDESGNGSYIHCVNSRWVSACDAEGVHVREDDEAYTVDVSEVPRGGGRRRKSMEPSTLINLGGNIVRDRRPSVGRSSLGRSPMKFESPARLLAETPIAATPRPEASDKENGGDDDPSSPATPAYLAAPDTLVQQTAPINRRRKLGAKAVEEAKNRRLTYFGARANGL